jgi:cyclase
MMQWLRSALVLLLCGIGCRADAQSAPPRQVAPGVWFLLGDASTGYCNTVVIEMDRYLIVVDGSYPGRVHELLQEIPKLSPKPIRYVFDTHAHGDHAYGNALWTKAGATTLAYAGVTREMDRYEPARWQMYMAKREDLRATGENDAERPKLTFSGSKFVLRDRTREVDFLFLGWAHTRGDGWVWLPKEQVLCTGDAAVNGPRNKLWDANIANWPRVVEKAAALHPAIVLPGHGAAGGAEILAGQARFLRDLYAAVGSEVHEGKKLEQVQSEVRLPDADSNWIPKDLSGDVEATYREIAEKKPMGALSHVWR